MSQQFFLLLTKVDLHKLLIEMEHHDVKSICSAKSLIATDHVPKF